MRNKRTVGSVLRVAVPVAVLAAAGIAFATGTTFGTLSAIGWGDVALLCPVGSLTAMLAAKSLVPRALVSLAVAAVLVVVFGRAFCGWVCPVPVVARLREVFAGGKDAGGKAKAERAATAAAAKPAQVPAAAAEPVPAAPAALSESEQALLRGCAGGCAERHGTFDARHLVLGGSLVSALAFGAPVFCLVCPVGLSFATVFLLVRAFGFGDVSWMLVAVPALLAAEAVFFRKWCHAFCPISALMSLVAKANRTFRPVVDATKCLENAHGASCGRCSRACEQGIDPHRPQLGNGMNECTRCRACVDACPAQALSIPLVHRAGKDGSMQVELASTQAERR